VPHVNSISRKRLPRIIKKIQNKRQKEPGEITEDNSACETGTGQQVARDDDDDDYDDDVYQ
jgi:hypothetical protein